jgi:hypothetical protein
MLCGKGQLRGHVNDEATVERIGIDVLSEELVEARQWRVSLDRFRDFVAIPIDHEQRRIGSIGLANGSEACEELSYEAGHEDVRDCYRLLVARGGFENF